MSSIDDCPILHDLATPKLYRNNAFRILGLGVEVGARRIAQRVNELEMLASFESSVPSTSTSTFSRAVTAEDVRNAAQRLRDPEKRLIDELFWFWPERWDSSDSDAAIEALSRGADTEAVNIWVARERDSARAAIASHNLAIVYHQLALECENQLEDNTADKETRTNIIQSWGRSSKRWTKVFDDNVIWNRLRQRVETVKDQALSPQFVERIRGALPSSLALINAELALCCASKANLVTARLHVEIARSLQPNQREFSRMVEAAIAPLHKRLREHLNRTTDRVNRDISSTLSSVRELLSDAKNVFEFTRLFFNPEEMPNRDLLEEVAVECNRLPTPYFNETGDNKGCLEIVELALSLAYSKEAREQIERSIKTLSKNIEEEKFKPITDLLVQIEQGKQSPSVKLRWFMRDAKPKLTAAIAAETETSSDSLWEVLDLAAIVLRNISLAAWNNYTDLKTALAANELASRYANKVELKASIATDQKTLANISARKKQEKQKAIGGIAIVGGFVLALIIAGLNSNNQGPSTNRTTYTTPPSSTYTSPRSVQPPSYNRTELDSLKTSIDSGRVEIAGLETQMQSIDSELESTNARIEVYKQSIDTLERNPRVTVDNYNYRRAIQEHNNLVAFYNARLQERRQLYRKYQELVRQDKARVEQYNALLNK